MDEQPDMRRRPARQQDLNQEIIAMLASAGLPMSQTDDRARALGVLVTRTDNQEGSGARVEWFVSKSLRNAAASEQLEGYAFGRAANLHLDASRAMIGGIKTLLESAGYTVVQAGNYPILIVSDERPQEIATLNAEIMRFVNSKAPTEIRERITKEMNEKGDDEGDKIPVAS